MAPKLYKKVRPRREIVIPHGLCLSPSSHSYRPLLLSSSLLEISPAMMKYQLLVLHDLVQKPVVLQRYAGAGCNGVIRCQSPVVWEEKESRAGVCAAALRDEKEIQRSAEWRVHKDEEGLILPHGVSVERKATSSWSIGMWL